MKVQPATKRVGEIEFFRAVFCLIIMIRHGEYLVGTTKIPFSGGAFAVEFFFLVSGYLMMANIARRQNEPTQHLGGETLRFVGKKMATFYPEMVTNPNEAIDITVTRLLSKIRTIAANGFS